MEFRVLGLLEVLQDGRPVELRGKKVRSLLAILVLHPGTVVSADRLAEALWGDDAPPTAASTLQVYVSQLRKALGSHVVHTRSPGYVLAVEADQIDAVRFERLVAQGRSLVRTDPTAAIARLTEALGLWRGPALADFTFEDFARADVARLEELRLTATEERTEAELALGRHDELVGPLRALVDDHPLRERLWGQLILSLYRSGRQAEALSAFSEVRRLLGEELGIEPGPALRQLEDDVLAQHPRLGVPPRPAVVDVEDRRKRELTMSPSERTVAGDLPVQLTGFVGRSDQIVEVRKLLAATRQLTLTGSGGIGKSRLALELANLVIADHRDGVRLAELAALEDPARVPEQVLASLGAPEASGRTATDRCVERLRDREVLLLLDNCEHLLPAAASLADALLRSCPGLRILATSRSPLRVPGEVVWRVPPLTAPEIRDVRRLPLEALFEYEAVQLFLERAMSSGPDWGVTPGDAPALAEICSRLDGVPLAIELAAARAPALSLDAIARHLDDRFRLLSAGATTAPRRHQSLRAALDWSYDLLDPSEKALLDALSVFAGGFSLEAAEAVCPGNEVEQAAIANLMASLADKSLVVAARKGGSIRYRLLDSLRSYASERLKASGHECHARHRHLAWAVSLASEAAVGLEGAKQHVWLAAIEGERDNLRAALEWGLSAPDQENVLRLAAALGRFWQMCGPGEGRAWLTKALAMNPGAAPEVRARALNSAAVLAQQQYDLPAARALFGESVDVWRALNDPLGVAASSHGLASIAAMEGDVVEARAILERNLSTGRQLGDDGIVAVSLHKLGYLFEWEYVKGRTDLLELAAKARPLYEQSLVTYRRMSDGRGVGMALESLATIAGFERNRVLERSLHEEALAVRQELGDKAGAARSLRFLGLLALTEDDYPTADVLAEQSLEIDQELGNTADVARTLVYRAEAAFGRGDYQQALRLLEDSLAIQRRRGDRIATAAVLSSLGATACRAREYTRARMALEEGEAIAKETGDPRQIAWSLARLGVLARAEGDPDRVESLWEEARAMTSVRHSPGAVGQFLELLAGVAAGRGHLVRAATLFGAADGIRGPDVGPKPVDDSPEYRRDVATVRQGLGDVAFQEAWAAGEMMTLEEVVRYPPASATNAEWGSNAHGSDQRTLSGGRP